jgi:hypothetical protein
MPYTTITAPTPTPIPTAIPIPPPLPIPKKRKTKKSISSAKIRSGKKGNFPGFLGCRLWKLWKSP